MVPTPPEGVLEGGEGWRFARVEAAGLPSGRPAAVELDNHFDDERPHPTWSVQATNDARRALTNTLPKGTTLKNVECRAKLCRIESVHDSVDAYREFTNSSLIGRGRQIWNGAISSLVRDQTPSGVVAVSYLSKEGEVIPAPEHPE